MKIYVNAAQWAAIEKVLMEAEVPYHVSFDSHVSEDLQTITYDRYIRIEPIVLQEEVRV